MEARERIVRRAFVALLLALLCSGCPRSEESTDSGDDPWPQDSIRVEETDLDTVFSDGWVHGNTAYDWSDGTAAVTRVPGSTMSFTFTGTRIRWLGWRDSTAGIARVWLDGESAGEVDLYFNGIEVQAPVFTSEVLEPGMHTLMIEAAGTANPASAGVKVVVDAFEIADGVAPPPVTRIEETDPSLGFTGEWRYEDRVCFTCSGAANSYARGPDALVSFSFTGTRVRWLGWRKDAAGIARVYLDGALAGEIDLYSNTPTAQAPLFTSEVLDDGPHTLLIEATGGANSVAGDTIVSVDAFDIVGDVPGAAAYTLTDLGTLGGAASSAQDINNRGEIVGWSNLADGKRRAFLYRDGVMTDLGTHVGGSFSEATAINDHGQVAGFSGINAYGPQFQEFMNGFLWNTGTMEVLHPLYCYCSFNSRYGTSAVYGINNSGRVAGWTGTLKGETTSRGDHAALWESGTVRSIGAPPRPGVQEWEYSRAFDINDAGQVVGDFTPNGFYDGIHERRAFLWRNDARQELGRLRGHVSSTALAINANGAVAGWSGSVDAAVARAFLWRHGTMQDLGTLPGAANSQALGINAQTQIVGWSGAAIAIDGLYRAPGSSEITDPAAARAFLWQHGRMFDLNGLTILDAAGAPASDWVLAQAAAINDAGQIVGTGFRNGEMRAFLLSPAGN